MKKIKLRGNLSKEIVVVNDGCTDNTHKILEKIKGITVVTYSKNKGKGAAVIAGLKKAKGGIYLIQDADLEYYPSDIPKIIKPILEGKADIVYGSRNLRKRTSYSSLLYYAGGLFIEAITNLILGTKITDSITGYKAFTRKVYKKISPIRSRGFEIEAEITAKAVKAGFTILEVPINYKARTHSQGKNIRWHHELIILRAVWKYSRKTG